MRSSGVSLCSNILNAMCQAWSSSSLCVGRPQRRSSSRRVTEGICCFTVSVSGRLFVLRLFRSALTQSKCNVSKPWWCMDVQANAATRLARKHVAHEKSLLWPLCVWLRNWLESHMFLPASLIKNVWAKMINNQHKAPRRVHIFAHTFVQSVLSHFDPCDHRMRVIAKGLGCFHRLAQATRCGTSRRHCAALVYVAETVSPCAPQKTGSTNWRLFFVFSVFRDEGGVAPLSQEGITSARTSMA